MLVRWLLLACAVLSLGTASLCAQELTYQLYQQGFETGLPSGEMGDFADTRWDIGNSTFDNAGIWHPTTTEFNSADPLAAPAEGNQVLFIDDFDGAMDNTFVAINTRLVLQEGGTYRITAATGHPLAGIGDQSIQAWVQPSPPDGGIDRREFIGQSFTT
jgi:hypothetical protein